MLRRDYHVHTAYCGHASGEMEQYVQQALSHGLSEICFCDHMPLQDGFDDEHRMGAKDVQPYIDEIFRLRDLYPQLIIHLGFEADYIAGMEEYLLNFRRKHGVDHFLMSIHFVTGWPAGEWTFAFPFGSGTIRNRYLDYFQTMKSGVKSGLFDAVAHIDLIKRPRYPVCDVVSDMVDEVLDAVAEVGMAVEYNTSGLRKPIAEAFPAEDLLARIVHRSIPVCLGSDAHHPEQVAYAFDDLQPLLGRYPGIKAYRIEPRFS